MEASKTMSDRLEELGARRERQEHLQHQDTLLALNVLLKTKEGKQLFKYLFKNLEVGQFPEQGTDGMFLHDRLGFLRAGNSIYKLVSEADAEIAASLLANIERERYEDMVEEYRIQNGID